VNGDILASQCFAWYGKHRHTAFLQIFVFYDLLVL
jgi:hypothetical protein